MSTEDAISELRAIETDLHRLAHRVHEVLQALGLSAETAEQVELEICAPSTMLECWVQQLS